MGKTRYWLQIQECAIMVMGIKMATLSAVFEKENYENREYKVEWVISNFPFLGIQKHNTNWEYKKNAN